MNHDYFTETYTGAYSHCILVPSIDLPDIQKYYTSNLPIPEDQIIVFDLYQDPVKKKTPRKDMVEYLEDVKKELRLANVTNIIVCDAEYFKALTKETKTDANIGYFFQVEEFSVTYLPNYKAMFYNPEAVKVKIDQALNSISTVYLGSYIAPGTNVIKHSFHPSTHLEIENCLYGLRKYESLSCDIETFDLKFYKAGLGSIAFAWDKHEGISFIIWDDPIIKRMLKEFFVAYTGNLKFHNAAFDVTVLIYQLFMDHLIDQEGLLEGLEVLTRNLHCTKIISYLATNTCAGNELGLKDQAREFIGNYAVDVKDITKLDRDALLKYNLEDTLSTEYVFNKNYPIMVEDDQLDIYTNLFLPALKDVIQMQLTGMPLSMDQVEKANVYLTSERDLAISQIQNSPHTKDIVDLLIGEWVIERNTKLKVKRVTKDDADIVFNPDSPLQLQKLVYGVLGLPILERTKTKQPATGKTILKALINHTDEQSVKDLLTSLVLYKDVNKILTAFIPHMLNAPKGNDGWNYLFGNFNLGGTVSGRLSSSEINLQQIPSTGSKYATVIKDCFSAPPGWLFVGLDFDSLEDKISALTTKDKNKIKVYTDGYDGHSFRAYYYYSEQLTHIPNTVEGINSIKELYPDLRQDSKEPTFLLTYWGTYHGLMKNCGFPKEKALSIAESFNDLYEDSRKYIQDKLKSASSCGYVDVAFGLRVRTPIMHQTVLGASSTPFEAEAEFRTAANACGQSYCLLNSRAGVEFLSKVRLSEYKHDIKPCAQIHDAQYYLVRDNVNIVNYVNEHLVKSVSWQELPEIVHDTVKLSGKLGIFYPTWSTEYTIPNGATVDDILSIGTKIGEKQ
jgi:DNA polymerase-1